MALGQPTNASTSQAGNKEWWKPSWAVDGRIFSDKLQDGTCFVTQHNAIHNYWYVNLGSKVFVGMVRIYTEKVYGKPDLTKTKK